MNPRSGPIPNPGEPAPRIRNFSGYPRLPIVVIMKNTFSISRSSTITTFRISSIPVRGILAALLPWLLWTSAWAQGPSSESVDFLLKNTVTAPLQEIDLGETALAISRRWNAEMGIAKFRNDLTRLVDSVRAKIGKGASPQATVEAMRQAIHQEGQYGYTDQVDAQGFPLDTEELFLHGLLGSKRGYCMSLSLLYLIVADRLNLPLYGVALPNHFFVRYDDGKTRINIESTESGATYPDDFYYQRFAIRSESPPLFFMKNLDKRQTLGAYYSNVGTVYFRHSRRDDAIFFLELATGINPDSMESQNNLANMYSETGKLDRAIEHYRRALEADPNSAATLFNLGIAYNEAKQPDKAIEAFLQTVQMDPEFERGHQALAQIYFERKNLYGALLHLKKLVSINRQNLGARLTMADVYLDLGQADLALQVLTTAESEFPGRYEIADKMAKTYYRTNRFEQAVARYRALIDQKPDLLSAYIQLGWTYYRMDDLPMAKGWTLRGLKQANGPEKLKTLAQMNLGLYAVLSQKFDEAREWYSKTLADKDPNTAAAILADLDEAGKGKYAHRTEMDYFAGWVAEQAGQAETARGFYQRYLSRDPGGVFSVDAKKALQGLGVTAPSPRQPGSKADKIPEGMISISAGFFIMGSNDHGDDEAPEHQVYLDAYLIDRYEVSARDFAGFLNAVNNVQGYYLDNKFGVLAFEDRFFPKTGLDSFPINNVKWEGARAFCEWKGKRLPTEAEWEKAARGSEGNIYPWGKEAPDPQRARFGQEWTEEKGPQVMAAVDAMPEGQSPFGAYHMAGNVKEWVYDWFDREYYKDQSQYVNPQGQIGGEFKVLKGGSWRDLKGFLYSSFRNNSYPETRMDDYGFRCAKSVEKASAGSKKLTLGPAKYFDLQSQTAQLKVEEHLP